MCILSGCWRRIWHRAFGPRQRPPDRNRRGDARLTTARRLRGDSATRTEQRVSKPPAPKRPPRLRDDTEQLLRRILDRYDEQLMGKSLYLFDLEKEKRKANDQLDLRLSEHQREVGLCGQDRHSLGVIGKETDRVSNHKSDADRHLVEARARIKEIKQGQSTDLLRYNDRIQKQIRAGGDRNESPKSFPSVPALDGLNQACESIEALRRKQKTLRDLRLELSHTREEAREKLQEAGLLQYEAKVQQLSREIENTERETYDLQRSRRSGFNAFYTARGRNLRRKKKKKNRQDEVELERPAYCNEERALQKDKCSQRATDIKLKREELEQFKGSYQIRLQQHVDEVTFGLEVSESLIRRLENWFTEAWIDHWRKLLNEIETLENAYLEEIKLSMKLGVRIVVDYQEIGNDLPELLGSHVDDEHTESLGSAAVDDIAQKIVRSTPRINEWMDITRQEAPPFVEAAIAALDGDSNTNQMTLAERAHHARVAAQNELPDYASLERFNEPPDDDSMRPWDSASLVDNRPRRKALLDQYRRQCADLDYD